MHPQCPSDLLLCILLGKQLSLQCAALRQSHWVSRIPHGGANSCTHNQIPVQHVTTHSSSASAVRLDGVPDWEARSVYAFWSRGNGVIRPRIGLERGDRAVGTGPQGTGEDGESFISTPVSVARLVGFPLAALHGQMVAGRCACMPGGRGPDGYLRWRSTLFLIGRWCALIEEWRSIVDRG